VGRVGDVVKCRVRLQRFGSRVQGVSVKDAAYLAVVLEERDCGDLDLDGGDAVVAAALRAWWLQRGGTATQA
ncbi:hypothetical protein HKX48_000253, partial [Thoreauomyces humboldtii]